MSITLLTIRIDLASSLAFKKLLIPKLLPKPIHAKICGGGLWAVVLRTRTHTCTYAHAHTQMLS